MELREYLFRNRITATAFGRKIGYAGGYISDISNGKKHPGRKLLGLIIRATGGEVTENDLPEGRKKCVSEKTPTYDTPDITL